MPELPEVETIRKGIAPFVTGETVSDIIVRERRLRWPVSVQLRSKLIGKTIRSITRRAKYIIFNTDHGCMLIHLGLCHRDIGRRTTQGAGTRQGTRRHRFS